MSFSLLVTFSVTLTWSKLAEEPETYFMSGPERRWGLFACGRLHRIRISDEDSWGIGKQKSLTQTMIGISPCVHCSIHRCQDHYNPRTIPEQDRSDSVNHSWTYFKNTQERINDKSLAITLKTLCHFSKETSPFIFCRSQLDP